MKHKLAFTLLSLILTITATGLTYAVAFIILYLVYGATMAAPVTTLDKYEPLFKAATTGLLLTPLGLLLGNFLTYKLADLLITKRRWDLPRPLIYIAIADSICLLPLVLLTLLKLIS